jgi:ribosomal protein S18 acetylase RimI-like enzyme
VAGITVREGTADDRDFVIDTARRFAAFGPPPWRSPLEVVGGEVRCLDEFFDGRLSGRTLLIAESSSSGAGDAAGRVALGFAFLEPAVDYFSGDPHGHIGMIAVTEAAEGRGAGAALMRGAEAWARANGYAWLTLNVFEGNARARGMYERHGYQVETLRYVKPID